MAIKICIIIISILILIIFRNCIIKLWKKLKENYRNIFLKIYIDIKKFIIKTTEIFWMIILGLVIMIPLFSYYFMEKVYNISYNEYKELLQITLNSNYVIVIGIIIIVYLFRNQLKKKIGQIKEVNTNGVKFATQLENTLRGSGNLENGKLENENCDNLIEDNEEVYKKVKDKMYNDTKVLNDENSKDVRIYELEEQLKDKDKEIKINQFINIKNHIAMTTNIILIYIKGKYKTVNNLFTVDELKQILKDTLTNNNIKVNLNLELNAIIQFLSVNNIIDTEDDQNYCITDYGIEFLNFLFEGRC